MTADLEQPVRGDHGTRTLAAQTHRNAGETGHGRGKPERADEAKWRDALGDTGGQNHTAQPVAVQTPAPEWVRDKAPSPVEAAESVAVARAAPLASSKSAIPQVATAARKSAPEPIADAGPDQLSNSDPSVDRVASGSDAPAPRLGTSLLTSQVTATPLPAKLDTLSDRTINFRSHDNVGQGTNSLSTLGAFGKVQDSATAALTTDIAQQPASEALPARLPDSAVLSVPTANADAATSGGSNGTNPDELLTGPRLTTPADRQWPKSDPAATITRVAHLLPNGASPSDNLESPQTPEIGLRPAGKPAVQDQLTPRLESGAIGGSVIAADSEAPSAVNGAEADPALAKAPTATRPVSKTGSIESLFQLRAMSDPALPAVDQGNLADPEPALTTQQVAVMPIANEANASAVVAAGIPLAEPNSDDGAKPQSPAPETTENVDESEPSPKLEGGTKADNSAGNPWERSATVAPTADRPLARAEPAPLSPLALPGAHTVQSAVVAESAMPALRGADLAQQIVRAMPIEPGQPVSIVLSPEELGTVRMVMQAKGDHVTLLIHADRSDTMELMRRATDELMLELRNSGFASVSLDFGQNRRQPMPQSQPLPVAQPYGDTPPPAVMPDTPAPVRQLAAGGLDLRL